jgi:hypothetical protein
MSTKTSIKRIAAVAALALTFGGFTAVSANAYTLEGGFRTLSWAATPSATGTTLVEWSAVVKVNASCSELGTNNGLVDAVVATTTAQLDQAPVGSNLLSNSPTWSTGTPTGYTNSNASAAVAAYSDESTGYRKATSVGCVASTSAMVGYKTVKFTPDKAGTYVVVLLPKGATTGALTTTVTVSDPTQKFATAFIGLSGTPSSDETAANLTFTAAANTTKKAVLTVRQYSTTDATTLATSAISKDVVVAISKGLVSKTDDYTAAAASVTTAAATAATNSYYVFANGTTGSASITVTVGGVLLATKTVVFNGAAKTLSAAVTTNSPTWIAPSTTTLLTVSAKDEAGNTASNTPVISVASATTSVATVTKISDTSVQITGVAAGTSVITISDSATSSPATSATYTVTVAPAISATLPTMTFDKTEYAAGELMTITIAAAAADNASFAAFSAAPTTSVNVVTVKNPFLVVDSVQTGRVALVSGKATWTAYAPITAGPITVTATSSTGSSATAAAVTATATVLSDGVAQAAADAAAEAIDAANAATDAANAAAEAADAATAAAQDAADAVAALSVQVSEEIAVLKAQNDALRKQLIALTNLIIKIQKKVKA